MAFTADIEDIDFDDEDFDSTDLPKALRKQIKILKKQVSDLSTENSALKGSERKRTIGQSLTERGLNPKIAAFVPQDLSAEEIDTWLEEYGDVFGGSPAATQEDPAETVIARDSEQAAAIRSMANAERNSSVTPPADLLSQINNAENMADLVALLR